MALMLAFSSNVFSQSEKDAKEIAKERKINAKLSESELNAKYSKLVKKVAKQLEKIGWRVKDGALPIAKQLDRYYNMICSYEYVESSEGLVPKYLLGKSSCVDETYDAAKKDAILHCRISIADMIREETKIEEIISMDTISVKKTLSFEGERIISTKTIIGIDSEGREVATYEVVTKTVTSEDSVSTTVILPRLEDVIPVMEVYRDRPGGFVEVRIVMAYERPIQNYSTQ